MKIFLLGGTGLAGQEIKNELINRKIDVVSIARKNADINFDLTDKNNFIELLNKHLPNVIINSAAIADIDFCEKNPEISKKINTELPKTVVDWCKNKNVEFVQISTDHFFKDNSNKAHSEVEEVYTKNIYATQKYEAENYSLKYKKSLILRTSIVGFRGWGKKSFAEWAFDSIMNDSEISLYKNVWTSSIDTKSFAKGMIDLILTENTYGLFNLASREVYSKALFVEEMAIQLKKKLSKANYIDISPSKSHRSISLGLNIDKVQKILNWKLPSMKEVVWTLLNCY